MLEACLITLTNVHHITSELFALVVYYAWEHLPNPVLWANFWFESSDRFFVNIVCSLAHLCSVFVGNEERLLRHVSSCYRKGEVDLRVPERPILVSWLYCSLCCA